MNDQWWTGIVGAVATALLAGTGWLFKWSFQLASDAQAARDKAKDEAHAEAIKRYEVALDAANARGDKYEDMVWRLLDVSGQLTEVAKGK
jgi:hypothetical protein